MVEVGRKRGCCLATVHSVSKFWVLWGSVVVPVNKVPIQTTSLGCKLRLNDGQLQGIHVWINIPGMSSLTPNPIISHT